MNLLPDFNERTGRPAEDGQGTIGYGGCTRCGVNRLERHVGVVDLDISFYSEGAVMLCADCAEQVGTLIGMISADTAVNLLAEIEDLKVEVANAEGIIADWRPLVDSVRKLASK